jgi:hypothetical protein
VAEPEQDEGVAVLRGPVALLGQRGEVGLVLHQDAGRQSLLQRRGEAAVPFGQPRGVTEFAGGGVDQPGGSDTDGVQPLDARLLGRTFDQGDRLLDGGPGVRTVADRHRRLGQHRAQQIRHEDGHALGPYVQCGQVRAVGDDPVQPGVRAASLFARLPHDAYESGHGEAFHQVGDGGPGQAGELLQLPCRQRAFPLEEAQGEPVVDGPGGAR